MIYTLIRVCFAVPWIAILGWVFWAGIDNIEGALVFFLIVAMGLAAAPISYIVAGIFSLLERVLPEGLLTEIYPQHLIGKFVVVWAVMFALSYLQWFHLVPKLVREFRRWRQRARA
jgi:hypothetical protein